MPEGCGSRREETRQRLSPRARGALRQTGGCCGGPRERCGQAEGRSAGLSRRRCSPTWEVAGERQSRRMGAATVSLKRAGVPGAQSPQRPRSILAPIARAACGRARFSRASNARSFLSRLCGVRRLSPGLPSSGQGWRLKRRWASARKSATLTSNTATPGRVPGAAAVSTYAWAVLLPGAWRAESKCPPAARRKQQSGVTHAARNRTFPRSTCRHFGRRCQARRGEE
jgi:hypothetical protein